MSKVALVAVLPSARSDGSALALSEIASLTFVRDIGDGNGAQDLGTVQGPFTDQSVNASDDAGDAAFQYGAYITDTQTPTSVKGIVSSLVTPTGGVVTPPAQLAPAAAPSVTATIVG